MISTYVSFVILTFLAASPTWAKPAAPSSKIETQRKADRAQREADAIDRFKQKSRHQALLRLKKGASLDELKKALPKDAEIVDGQGSLVLVRLKRAVTEDVLDELSDLSGVEHAEADSVATQQEDVVQCQSADGAPSIPLPILPASLKSCPTTALCDGSGKAKLWGQERIDADLMADELKRIGIAKGAVKVAVVDSGFDKTNATKYMASNSLKVVKGHKDAGDDTRDEDGHGTMVAGLIGGKDGVGIAPQADLTVYRVSEPESHGKATNASLKLSIEKACSEGNEIINMSWGGLFDELGVSSDEKSDPKFLKDLADRGCLVVKAAGNSGIKKRDNSANDPDDAYLRVAATSQSGGLSDFSTPGEVSAPGSGIFTLESSNVPGDDKAKDDNLCGKEPGRFASGTSFAAPIVAAIATQVTAVLKKSQKYPSLSGPQKIALINRILIASQVAGSANALRAVLIAERWTQSNDIKIPATSELAASLASPEHDACKAKSEACEKCTNCSNFVDCIKGMRKRLTLCKMCGPDELSRLIELQIGQGNLEGAAGSLHFFKASGTKASPSLSAAAEHLWDTYISLWTNKKGGYSSEINLKFGLDFEASIDVLAVYLPTQKDKEKARKALLTLLSSYKASVRISESPDKGGDDSFASLYPLVQAFASQLGADEAMKVIEDWYNDIYKYKSAPKKFEEVVGFLRVLNAMSKDKIFADHTAKIEQYEKEIFEKLGGNHSDFLTRSSLSYAEAFLIKFKKQLEEQATAAADTGDYSKIGSLQAVYLVTKPEIIPEAKRDQYVLTLLEKMSKNEASWGGTNSLLAERGTKYLEESAKKGNAVTKKMIAERYRKLVSESQNLEVITGALPSGGLGGTYFSWTLKDQVDTSSLVDRKFLFQLSRQTMLAMAKMGPKESEPRALERKQAMGKLIAMMIEDPNPNAVEPKSFTAPIIGTKTPVTIENKTVGGVMNEFLVSLLKDYRDAMSGDYKYSENSSRRLWGLDPIEEIFANDDYKKLLPPDGAWKDETKAMLADMDAGKIAISPSALKKLHKNSGL